MTTSLLFLACGPAAADAPSVVEQLQDQFVDVSRRVGPAVVSISTEVTQKVQLRRRSMGSPFPEFNDERFDRFFSDFFGQVPEREFKQRGLGTGVIIDGEGVILTNEHVIHGADKVTVTLPDGREFKGQIKGSDLRSDMAVIKIQAKNLPVAELGDSESVKIGQWAIAIGNPFGFAVGGSEPTVTVGVISALNRSIRSGPERDYSSLIQTDAAINPGNSGGPLVNLKGQVIGINVAIFSTTGGYQGVGFAIPSNRAKSILEDLIHGKKVLYGWLGINVQDLTEELAKQFGLESKEGVIVAKVLPGSPGEKGGLKDGDVIKSYDGQPIKDIRELLKQVARTKVGKRVALQILRDRRLVNVTVEVSERPSESENGEAGEAPREEKTWRGLEVGTITPELAERFQLKETQGVLVTRVEPGSPAEEAGLRVGDVIHGLGRQSINSTGDFKKASQAVKGDTLLKTSRGFVVVPEGSE
ncbi:MAG: Do family serine endopeptidase [Candidatus Omnitrophica bacterium]|nr:Do family serine endopeptidase [Candidatus Omnitrophota bacterium]